MTQINTDSALADALAVIGNDAGTREAFLDLIKQAEKKMPHVPERSVRDDVTGILIDALHRDVGLMRRQLKGGVTFDFLYRSKIARDFVMAEPKEPDHAWEPQTTKLLLHLALGARQVVIGGAYFGDHAVLVAKAIAPRGGIVHAFEPNPEQREMLRHNVALNNLDNVRINGLGLWRDGNTHLHLVGEDSYAYPEVVAEETADSFPTTTIDDYLKAVGVDYADLIMLDIEGAELPALEGAARQLRNAQAPVVVFEVHRQFVDWSNGLENADIIRVLSSLGYSMFAVRDIQSNYAMGDKPVELIPTEHVYLEGPPHGFNMVAVEDPAIFDSRFFRICHGVSPKLLPHKDPALPPPLGGF